MQKYFNSIQNSRGDAIVGARVTVMTAAGSLATIYSDNGVTTQTNPMVTDGNGFFAFYAADGRYNLRIAAVGIKPIAIDDILLEDIGDQLTDFEERVYPGVYETPPTTRPSGAVCVEGDRCTIMVDGIGYEHLRSGGVWVIPNIDATTLALPTGAQGVGIQLPGGSAQPSNLYDLVARNFSLFGWLTKAQINAIVAGTFGAAASCSTAVHNAMVDVSALGGGVITCPAGGYLLDTINSGAGNESTYVVLRSGVSLIGSGDATEFRVGNGQNALRMWNIFLTPGKLENCIFRDFKINGNAANNLLAAGPARSNRALSATGGGKNITVDNVTFTGIPGNNTVAFSGSVDCGNIRVQFCRFNEMGSGIPGNVCLDHTDIYLCGEDNKVLYNRFKSTNFIEGATWEFHGDRGEACGNVVVGYKNGCWIAPMEQLIFTSTHIHHNEFLECYTGPYLSSYDNSQYGLLDIHDNTMTMKAGAYAAGIRIFGVYGPDRPGAFVDELRFVNNRVIGVPGEAVVGAQPIQAFKANIAFNHFEDFHHGIRVNGQGGALGSTYDYHEVLLQGNTIKNSANIPLYYLLSKSKTLVVTGNTLVTEAAFSNGMVLNGTTDAGLVEGNQISERYTVPISALNAGLATVSFSQAGAPGVRYVRYCPTSLSSGLNRVVYTAGTAAPSTGRGEIGDVSIASNPVAGQPRGHRCTVAGNPGGWVSEGNL